MAISARPYGQRAVLKFAQYTGCLSIAGRFTPGTFTNQITKQFREPRLLIITDPRPDAQVRYTARYSTGRPSSAPYLVLWLLFVVSKPRGGNMKATTITTVCFLNL